MFEERVGPPKILYTLYTISETLVFTNPYHPSTSLHTSEISDFSDSANRALNLLGAVFNLINVDECSLHTYKLF